jgi:hypothetical protein
VLIENINCHSGLQCKALVTRLGLHMSQRSHTDANGGPDSEAGSSVTAPATRWALNAVREPLTVPPSDKVGGYAVGSESTTGERRGQVLAPEQGQRAGQESAGLP